MKLKFFGQRFRYYKYRFHTVLHVEQAAHQIAEGSSRWTNVDLDPVPFQARKWTVKSFVTYWISDALNSSTWQFASSIIALGLTWRESLAIVAIAFFIISWVIAFNGATGIIYHVPFPVIARASWGFRGSFIPIFSRLILAVFWFSLQTLNGGRTVQVMIGAIWPSFLRLPNHIPENEGITTPTMIAFFLFWLIQLPFLWMKPNDLRWLFAAKSIIVPVAFIAILIWALMSAKDDIWAQECSLSGSAYSWAFLASLTSVIGNYSTLSVNQADFSRYAKISAKTQLMYVPLLPLSFTFIAFIGIAATSAGIAQYGNRDTMWDPMVLISMWPSRASRFFASFAFVVATVGVNISANSLSAANDMTALFPRYMNLRRGQLTCAVLAWMLLPWRILKSAPAFMNFMSAYSVFLGPIAAIMLFDFWVVHDRKYDTRELYKQDGIYSYTYGVNWRAVVAFLVGVAPNLPGFIQSVNANIDVGIAGRPYDFGWLLGFFGTAIVYLVLEFVFEPKETIIQHAVLPDDVYNEMRFHGDMECVCFQWKPEEDDPQLVGHVVGMSKIQKFAETVL